MADCDIQGNPENLHEVFCESDIRVTGAINIECPEGQQPATNQPATLDLNASGEAPSQTYRHIIRGRNRGQIQQQARQALRQGYCKLLIVIPPGLNTGERINLGRVDVSRCDKVNVRIVTYQSRPTIPPPTGPRPTVPPPTGPPPTTPPRPTTTATDPLPTQPLPSSPKPTTEPNPTTESNP